MRVKIVAMGAAVVILGTVAAVVLLGGCEARSDRTGRVLAMAAEESGFITVLQDRLTRQLNIADILIREGRPGEAARTLAFAKATLKVEEKENKTLDDFRRIAGWTSVAELARRAGDRSLATDAAVEAVEALHSVKPEAKRAEYVLSLATVLKELQGATEAGRLLEQGGGWAAKIPDASVRRFALASFAGRLLDWELYEPAQRTLRNELDASWRADTLVAMAGLETRAQGSAAGASFARALKAPAAAPAFNADVTYENNYRRPDLQQKWSQKD